MKKYTIFALISLAMLFFSLQLDSFAYRFKGEDFAAAAQFFSKVGNGATLFGISLILFMAGIIFKKGNIKDSGLNGFAVILAATFFIHLFKTVFERPRPSWGSIDIVSLLQNPSIFDFSGKLNSFPSGHTTTSFALACVLSRSYPRLSPLFYTIATLVGLSRVYLGSHYPSDVAGGAILGTGIGMFLFSEARKKYWPTALLCVAAISISFFKLGGLLLFDVDEAVFSEATREMIETGNYITPTYNYEPRYDKPILFYWLMAVPFKLFGVTEFSARFTSALFGTALVIMTFFFIKKLYGQRQGILTGLCLLLNLEFFLYTHSAVTDMTLTFFITASLYSFYIGFQSKTENPQSAIHNKWYFFFWLSAALATLTKGVIGILFPMTIILIYLLSIKRFKDIRTLLAPKFLLFFLAIASPWYIAQLYINGWEFFNAFIIKHHFQRYTGVISSHGGPIYFYIPVILMGFFPWVAFFPYAIYRGFKEKGVYLFGAIWFLFIFIFFSISRTKLPNYIMPLFPAMAIVTGLALHDIIEKRMERTWLFLSCVILIIISLALSITSFILPLYITIEIPLPLFFFLGLGLSFLSIAIFSFIILKGRAPFAAMSGIIAAAAIFLIVLRVHGAPHANSYLQKTLYQYSVYARKNLGEAGILATYEINQPSIAFYSMRRILKLDGENGIKELLEIKNSQNIIVITGSRRAEELAAKTGLTLIDTEGRYSLLGNKGR